MSKRIVVTSGKGGVGKTSIVSGLGYALAGMGYKTMLIDMDFGLNNLDVMMGIENKIVYDIIDVIEGKCNPKDALVEDFFEPNLFTFPSTHSYCSVKFGGVILNRIISSLEDYFDYILIDCPAGIDGGYKRAIECGEEYIVVTTPHLSAIRDASKVIENIKGQNGVTPYLIVNKVRGDLILSKECVDIDSIAQYLPAKIIGVLPENDFAYKQTLWNERNYNSDYDISLNMIAKNIVLGKDTIFDCTTRYRGILGGIRKYLKKRI